MKLIIRISITSFVVNNILKQHMGSPNVALLQVSYLSINMRLYFMFHNVPPLITSAF